LPPPQSPLSQHVLVPIMTSFAQRSAAGRTDSADRSQPTASSPSPYLLPSSGAMRQDAGNTLGPNSIDSNLNLAGLAPSSPYPSSASPFYSALSSAQRPRAQTASAFPSPPLNVPDSSSSPASRPSTRAGLNLPPPPSAMYPNQQNQPRGFPVPPPPPPPPSLSPPTANQIGGGMVLPPPPPRYPSTPGGMLGPGGLPPPPGPPPSSAKGQQAPWHGSWGRNFIPNGTYIPPPPPPGGVPIPYNPQKHAAVAAGGTMGVPPPPPPSEQMSATYIPSADTYGEGVGIPGLGGIIDDLALYSASSQNTQSGTWGRTPTMSAASDGTTLTTPSESGPGRGQSTTSNISNGIPRELAAQWPLTRVLDWLQANGFSKDWQKTFEGLNLHGARFLELGSGQHGRGNFGMMHQQVYPRLAQECTSSKTGWDQPREREEGKRMRRLVRSIVTGRPVDLYKMNTAHARKESVSGPQSLPSAGAGTDGDSPNVSWQLGACKCA